jgi:hypothetical protein
MKAGANFSIFMRTKLKTLVQGKESFGPMHKPQLQWLW